MKPTHKKSKSKDAKLPKRKSSELEEIKIDDDDLEIESIKIHSSSQHLSTQEVINDTDIWQKIDEKPKLIASLVHHIWEKSWDKSLENPKTPPKVI